MGTRRMPRGGRLAVGALFAAAVLFYRAGAITVTRTGVDVFWGQRPAAAAAEPVADITPPVRAVVVPTRPDEWFTPSGRNLGTEGLATFLARLALQDNAPLYLSDGWGRTTGPEASDHHITRTDSWACDLAVRGVNDPTSPAATAAARIASALGEPGWTGGNLVKIIHGYRFQVLWLVAGHFDHVHIGVRRMAGPTTG